MTLTSTPCDLSTMSLFQDLKLKRRKIDSRCSSDGKLIRITLYYVAFKIHLVYNLKVENSRTFDLYFISIANILSMMINMIFSHFRFGFLVLYIYNMKTT